MSPDPSTVRNIACDWRDLALGFQQIMGEATEASSIWIPVREQPSKTVRRERLSPEDVALYSGTIEIVPSSGSTYGDERVADVVADFLHGNVISWRELDLHRDVDREINRGPHSIVQHVRELLGGSPTDSFAIEHSPGAGGTTVARRIAWELRDEFPCVVIKTFTENTVDFIEALFQRSALPVLIVAESARLPGTQREVFFNDMKGRNMRFVILDVRRRHLPRDTATSVALKDPMVVAETQRFLAQYEPKAPEDRRAALRRLVSDTTLEPYRSPFFFGLYAFERDFVRVEQFVHDLLSEVPQLARRSIAQLALITRYSQERLPIEAFLVVMGVDTHQKQVITGKLFGDAAAKLVMYDGKRIGISHPLLAEEILRQHLYSPDATLRDAWRANLGDFCISFIRDMSDERLADSAKIQEILTDLFIERDFWQGSTDPALFSALLRQLPTREGERRVLECLCERFPNNAHFWSHLGRHINLRGTGSFEEAKAKLQRAIELEPKDEVHQHGLGMVYRLEVKRRLRDNLSGGETLRDRFESVLPIFEQAEACFATARKLNPDSQYPVVTPIQMIAESFERFARLSGTSDYRTFLVRPDVVSEWCRAKIATAQSLRSCLGCGWNLKAA